MSIQEGKATQNGNKYPLPPQSGGGVGCGGGVGTNNDHQSLNNTLFNNFPGMYVNLHLSVCTLFPYNKAEYDFINHI